MEGHSFIVLLTHLFRAGLWRAANMLICISVRMKPGIA